MTPGRPAATSPSNTMICWRPGNAPFTSSTFATCAAVEQNTATDSESRKMYSVCLAVSVG